MDSGKKHYTWQDIQKITKELRNDLDWALGEHEIPKDETLCLLGLLRGGYHPTRLLRVHYPISPILYYGISFYNGQTKQNSARTYLDETLEEIETNHKIRNILLIDDICDTGETLAFMRARLDKPVVTATLIRKTCSTFVPDATGQLVDPDEWVVFPWEL